MILWINCKDNEITYNKKQYLLRAAKRLGLTNVRDMATWTGDEERDAVLNIEPYSNFTTGSKWTGMWLIDTLFDKTFSQSDMVVSDDLFLAISDTTKQPYINNYKEKTTVLFQACDPSLHKRLDIEPEFDFIMCGTNGDTMHRQRAEYITHLKSSFTFDDFGKDHIPTEYVKMLNKARVQFIRSAGENPEQGEIAQRFFECLAIGPVLTNYVKDLEDTGLIEGVDYMSYKTLEEADAKMHKLIDDENLRNTIASNGRKKALIYHTYENRLVTILNFIYEKKGTRG